MFGGLTTNAYADIDTVKAFIDTLDAESHIVTPADQIRIKAYAVSACVTRLYAIYERYVESLISDYLDALPELMTFAELPDTVKKEYRIGFSSVLGKIDHRRYRNLSHENLVQWYSQALAGVTPYKIISQALIRHDDNLRLPTIEGMVARVGLGELRPWLAGHSAILALHERPEGITDKLEAELRAFVELRNDAAHGTLDDDLVGKDILHRYCSLVRSFIFALSSFFHKALLLDRVQAGTILHLGSVTEVFRGAGAGIIQLAAHRGLSQEMVIHMVGANYCYSELPKSLQIEGEKIEGISALENALELGYVGQELPRRNAQVYVDVMALTRPDV